MKSSRPQLTGKWLSEAKRKLITHLLARKAGVIARVKDGFVIVMKGEDENTYEGILQAGHRYITFHILGGSSAEVSAAQTALQNFVFRFADLVHERDLSLNLIKNFLCAYLRKRLYREEAENVCAIEVVVVQLTTYPADKMTLKIVQIGFDGDHRFFKKDDRYSIFGCTDIAKQKRLAAALARAGLERLSIDEAIPRLKKLLGGFSGEFFDSCLEMTEAKS